MKNYGSYINKMFEKKILIFAVIWSILSFFIATAVAQILEAINTIMDFLLKVIIYGISGPGLISSYIPFFGQQTFIRFGITFIIALALSPLAYRLFLAISSIMKKSPI